MNDQNKNTATQPLYTASAAGLDFASSSLEATPNVIQASPVTSPAPGETAGSWPASQSSISSESRIPRPSKAAWIVALVIFIGISSGVAALLLKGNTPAAKLAVSSQQLGQNSQQNLGNIKGESVSFSIDTKIAGGKTLTATGPVIIQNTDNSTSALQVQNAAGSNLFVADTVNNKIGIGAAPTATGALLQVNGDISASGSVSADNGATILNNNGLMINNVLICTSSGCKNLAAQAASGQVFTGDASTLNGQSGSYYRDASNINAGTLNDNRLSGNVALLSASQTYSGINSFTAAGNTFVGDGSGLSSLRAGGITSGTLADSRLSSNVALLNAANNFTNAGNSFKGNGSGLTSLNAANVSNGTLSDNRLSGNVTRAGNSFNGLSELVMLDSSGLLPALDASALMNLNAGAVSIGTISDSHLSVNVTLAGNSFNGASQLVKLNASGDIPALSGINLTNLNASAISGGTLNDLRLSPNVTLQGNTFNGASQLVQTTNQSYFPALNGSLITNLDAGNIASGTLSDSHLSANVALLGVVSQTFSGNETFSNIITAPGLETTNSGHNIALGFSGTATGNVTYNFDVAAAPGTYSICTSAGNCPGPSGGVTTTGGTINHLAKFNGAQTIIDSIISDNGSTVTINGDLAANNITQNSNAVCDVSGNCAGVGGQVGGTGTSNKIALFSGTSTIADSIISQSGTTVSVGGNLNLTGQYQLNGAQVSSSILSDASNLALLNGSQTFSGNNLFTGNLQVQPASDSITALLVTNHAGSNNILTVDTANGRVGVGVQPGYTLDVAGDINVSSGSSYRINGVAICGPSATCAPASGSGNYIQNSVSQQANANINIQSVNSGSIVAVLRGASGQTADLLRAQDGSGSNVFTVGVNGSVNTTGQYNINGSPICTSSGCTAASGSGSYIQNGTSPQTADYNITGNGTIGGTLGVTSSVTAGQFVSASNGKAAINLTDTTGTPGITLGGDTTLYRVTASSLKTDSEFVVGGPDLTISAGFLQGLRTNGTDSFLKSATGVDPQYRFQSDINGKLQWGDGTSAPDTNLYRAAASTLKTDGSLQVASNVRVGSTQYFSFGPTDSIKLQDGGSNQLNIYTSSALQASVDASGNFVLSGNGLLVMGTKTSDPACTNGATYYNSTTKTFRGCANGVWNDFAMGSTVPVGTISPFAGSSAPSGYLIADGSAVSRTTYSTLFALIGTTYGAGDGSTTFNLPDLRGRVAVGLGTNADDNSLGANDGSALANRTPKHNSTLNLPSISRTADVVLNDPGHSHSIYNFFGGGVTQSGALCGCNNGGGTTSTNNSYTGITVSQQPNFALSGGSVGPGGSRPTDTPAYVTVNYIIKY